MSVGLLRGDKIQDSLSVQETSASPLFKRTRNSPPRSGDSPFATPPGATDEDMAMTMAEFKAYMDNNTNRDLSNIKDGLADVKRSVARIDSNVKENTRQLEAHTAKIDRNQACISKLEEEISRMKSKPAFPSLPERPVPTGFLTRPEESRSEPEVDDPEYNLARRSLRIWPVKGSDPRQLKMAAGIFLGTNLAMSGVIGDSNITSISRPVSASGPGVTDEVIIVFADIASRDLVMGASSRLAPFVNEDGRPTAGIRLEIPPRLQRDFRTLSLYGRNLRARHGHGTRRHVKFDDHDRSLFLNVKLPGDTTWSKVTIDIARRGIRARESLRSEELEQRLDITGPMRSPARPRTTSLSSTATTGSAPGTWAARPSSSAS